MTDKEIIKTLTKAVFIGDSPIGKDFGTIIDKQTVKETIDFINRQKAEIERLKTAYPKTLESIRKIYTTAKSDAIKEFMDSLKAKAQNATTWTGIEPVVTISDIEDTAKEMVGDEVV